MFPLAISLPRHKETVVIILVDKYCGLIETVAFRVRLAEHQARKLKRMITKLFFKKVQPDIE